MFGEFDKVAKADALLHDLKFGMATSSNRADQPEGPMQPSSADHLVMKLFATPLPKPANQKV